MKEVLLTDQKTRLWYFEEFKQDISLKFVAQHLDIPSPKEKIQMTPQ